MMTKMYTQESFKRTRGIYRSGRALKKISHSFWLEEVELSTRLEEEEVDKRVRMGAIEEMAIELMEGEIRMPLKILKKWRKETLTTAKRI